MSAAPAAETSLPDTGSVVGDYVLESVISEGGMGRVYRAKHQRLGRQVALKMLLPRVAADAGHLRRFFAEARAVNRIRHEHLIEVTDFAEANGGPAYYIMELLAGRSLREHLEQGAGRLTLKRSMHIWLQLADVLAALHEDCVVHRDLKPDNVFLLTRDGIQDYVKLFDFGAARLLDDEGALIVPEKSDVIIGTPLYMAPEQADGGDVDDLADIYAFGVMMYEMISGKHPHDGNDLREVLVRKCTADAIAVAELPGLPEPVPQELNELVMQCLARKPADRPQSMQEVRLRLMLLDSLQVKGEAGRVLTPTSFGEGALARRRRQRQRKLVLSVIGAAAAVIVVLLALSGLFTRREPTVEPAPPVTPPVAAGDAEPKVDPATSADTAQAEPAKKAKTGKKGRLRKGGFIDPFERRK
ncbi:MAG: serine/threonine-protein kinase [Myxococcota bacterium]|nr:serine/threonine-protein kinase [Myxococcota bacterium]